MYEFECARASRDGDLGRARRVTEISGARVQCTKICDLFLRSKACSVRRGPKRSGLHISAFLTCCIDVAGGGVPVTMGYKILHLDITVMVCAPTQTTNHSLLGRNTSEVIFLRLVEEIQNTTCRSSTWKHVETHGKQRAPYSRRAEVGMHK